MSSNAGWNLKFGECSNPNLSDDQYWEVINNALTNAKRTSSYKFCFLKCVLDVLDNRDANYTLSFDQIFSGFAPIYWNLVHVYKLRQISDHVRYEKSEAEKIVDNVASRPGIIADLTFNQLDIAIQEEIQNRCVKECCRNVVGAFYQDTDQKLYAFSKEHRTVSLNPNVFVFLEKNKRLIQQANCFVWAKFLERINPEINGVATKLDEALQS